MKATNNKLEHKNYQLLKRCYALILVAKSDVLILQFRFDKPLGMPIK
jgi:hypothetical protein